MVQALTKVVTFDEFIAKNVSLNPIATNQDMSQMSSFSIDK
jgi:hypothetical protein